MKNRSVRQPPRAEESDSETPVNRAPSLAARRHFLKASGALVGAGAATAGTVLAQGSAPAGLPVPASMKTPGAVVGGDRLYGKPSAFEKKVVRRAPPGQTYIATQQTRTPLEELDGIITPNGLFYERHHAGIPDIDPASHRLMLHGLVRNPLLFSLDDLRRLPSVSRIHFIECSGNPAYTRPNTKKAGDLFGLVSCAEWTGVSLKVLLEEAGLKPEAKWVVAEGADSAAMNRSVPLEKCLEDALVVYSQNGERLRPEQGYPIRLLCPGYEGNMSIKWLRRLHVTDAPVYSREETSKYTDLQPDGKARQFTFFMEAKSIITRPSGEQRIPSPGFVEITGIAWSGRGKIAKVDVSVDGGRTWAPAALQEPVLSRALTRFRYPWQWTGQPAVIQSRATDESGYVQPAFEELLALRGEAHGYHNNSVQAWRVAANGAISNARN